MSAFQEALTILVSGEYGTLLLESFWADPNSGRIFFIGLSPLAAIILFELMFSGGGLLDRYSPSVMYLSFCVFASDAFRLAPADMCLSSPGEFGSGKLIPSALLT